jgi:hypothetical protein
MPRQYTTPLAFKTALEQRLRDSSAGGTDFARRRQLIVFDRFLARVTQHLGDRVLLKGGLVLELRVQRARTTKDVDLRCTVDPKLVLEHLQEAGRMQLGDFMTYEIIPDARHPDIHNEGMKYDGFRFRAECRLAGKISSGSQTSGAGRNSLFARSRSRRPGRPTRGIRSCHCTQPQTMRTFERLAVSL